MRVADNFDADRFSGSAVLSIHSLKAAPGVKTSRAVLQPLPFQASPHRHGVLFVYRVCVSYGTTVDIP